MTVALLYLMAIFSAICFLFATPALIEVARSVPPGPEQEEAAREAAAAAVRPRLPIALALAVLTTGLGLYFRRLPGIAAPPEDGGSAR